MLKPSFRLLNNDFLFSVYYFRLKIRSLIPGWCPVKLFNKSVIKKVKKKSNFMLDIKEFLAYIGKFDPLFLPKVNLLILSVLDKINLSLKKYKIKSLDSKKIC